MTGDAKVTYPPGVREAPGSIPGSDKDFMFDFVFCCCGGFIVQYKLKRCLKKECC